MLYNLPSRSLTLLERLPNVVILVFNGEKLSYINSHLAQQLGYGTLELHKMSYRELIQESDWHTLRGRGNVSPQSVRFMRLSLRGKENARVEVNVCADQWREGREHWLLLWGDKTPAGLAPRCEEEERESHAQSINFDEGYGASFSHEVRNPLSALVGLVGLLQETSLDEEQQRLVTTISGVAEQLMTLLNDMIDSSRFQMGKIIISRKPFTLRPILEMLFSRYELLSPHLHFSLEYDSSLPAVVLGDSHRLMQILTNLLTNAVKYTPNGAISLRVKNMHNSRDVLFEVQDTGTGISNETLERLFAPFERGSEVVENTGFGLGLFISKQLVEMHGGTIQAFSRVGKGSTMQVTLPLISADIIGTIVEPTAPAVKGGSAAGSAKSKAGSAGKRILVVDDNRINVLVVTKFLNKWGVANDSAYSGEEALRKLDTNDYALVFMDLRMPGMDGFETSRRIRGREDAKSQTPIIALTASTEMRVTDRIAEAGMNGYIFKPFKTERLHEIVDQYVLSDTPSADSATNAKE